MSKNQTSMLVREEKLLLLLSPDGMTPAVYSLLLAGILTWAKKKAREIANLEKHGAKFTEPILLLKQTFKQHRSWVWKLNTFAQAKAKSLPEGHQEAWLLLVLDCYTTLYGLEKYKRRFRIKEEPNGHVQKGK